MIDQPINWEEEGYYDGETATRTRGGTRGAEWNADQKGLVGEDWTDYVAGFNNALSHWERYAGTDAE